MVILKSSLILPLVKDSKPIDYQGVTVAFDQENEMFTVDDISGELDGNSFICSTCGNTSTSLFVYHDHMTCDSCATYKEHMYSAFALARNVDSEFEWKPSFPKKPKGMTKAKYVILKNLFADDLTLYVDKYIQAKENTTEGG